MRAAACADPGAAPQANTNIRFHCENGGRPRRQIVDLDGPRGVARTDGRIDLIGRI